MTNESVRMVDSYFEHERINDYMHLSSCNYVINDTTSPHCRFCLLFLKYILYCDVPLLPTENSEEVAKIIKLSCRSNSVSWFNGSDIQINQFTSIDD